MRLIKDICIILFTALALFLITDLMLSVFNPFQQFRLDLFQTEGNVFHVRHPVYHHDLAPNANIIAGWGKMRYRACTDENGFLISCARAGKKSGRHFDLAFIGDSFTESVGYAFEETAVGRYVAAHPELRIANLGVSSYSPSIYLRKIRFLLDQGYSFGRIVILMDVSDIDDESYYYVWRSDRIADKNDPDCALLRTPFVQYFKYTTWILEPLLRKLFPFHDPLSGLYGERTRDNWPYRLENESVRHGMGQATESMRALKSLLDSRDIPMSMGVYPWPEQLRRGDARHRGVTLWEEFCAREKCRAFVDANPRLFQEAQKNGTEAVIEKYYIHGDVHFNAEGNRLLFETLEEAGL